MGTCSHPSGLSELCGVITQLCENTCKQLAMMQQEVPLSVTMHWAFVQADKVVNFSGSGHDKGCSVAIAGIVSVLAKRACICS